MIPARKLYFIGLNIVRALSVVSLILVFSSTVLVIVNNVKAVNAFEDAKIKANGTVSIEEMLDCEYIEGSTVPNQPAGAFWAIVASLLIIFQTIILMLSEASWPMAFFDRFFPVLGTDFGLGALGIFQGLIATQILSHNVDDFTLVSAFFLFSVGCINMLLGLIFRQGAKEKRSIRGWRAEARGVLPAEKDNRPVFANPTPTYVANMFTSQNPSIAEKGGYLHERSDSWRSTDKSGLGFGRQAEKAAGLRGFVLQKPEESLPRYVTPPPTNGARSYLSRTNTHVSSSSSFSSSSRPETRQEQLHNAILSHPSPRGMRDDYEPESRPETPVFKSSRTAL